MRTPQVKLQLALVLIAAISFIPTRAQDAPPLTISSPRRYHVPIGIASVGHGFTSVRQWLPADTPVHVMPTMTRYVRTDSAGTFVSDGALFAGMMLRIHRLGVHGFRALLWHQGESDSHQPAEHD